MSPTLYWLHVPMCKCAKISRAHQNGTQTHKLHFPTLSQSSKNENCHFFLVEPVQTVASPITATRKCNFFPCALFGWPWHWPCAACSCPCPWAPRQKTSKWPPLRCAGISKAWRLVNRVQPWKSANPPTWGSARGRARTWGEFGENHCFGSFEISIPWGSNNKFWYHSTALGLLYWNDIKIQMILWFLTNIWPKSMKPMTKQPIMATTCPNVKLAWEFYIST